MKHWPSQLFPIVLLSLLAGLSFILASAVDRSNAQVSGKARHARDAAAENFSIRHFDENGRIKSRLVAPYMEHYPDDSSLVNNPTFVAYRQTAEPLTISSNHGQITSRGDVIYLWEDVIAHREATALRPAILVRMPDLTVQTKEGIGFTSSPVEITQLNSWLKGTGMDLDNNLSTFVLRSQVTGLYYSPKAKP